MLGMAGPGLGQVLPTRLVRSAAELEDAFRNAPDGSRLLLAPGQYDQARLSARSFARGLLITSADPSSRAVFSQNLYLNGVENVTITGVDFTTARFFEHQGRMDKVQLGLTSCRDVLISDATFTGYIPTVEEGIDPESPDLERHFALAGYTRDNGLALVECENIQAEGLRMLDLRTALTCGSCERIRLYGIEVAGAREGVNFLDTRDLTIAECHFYGFKPWLAKASPNRDHPDMIQYWAGTKEIGVHRIEIRDCLFHQGPGLPWTQSIFGHLRNRSGQADKASEIYVSGNTIINRHIWAIYLGEASQVVVTDNLLLPSPDLPDDPEQINTPTISLEGCRDVDVIRNTLLPFQGPDRPIRADKGALKDGRVRLASDNRFLDTRPVVPNFWRKVTPDLASPAAAYRARRGWTG
ncbi:hypothetical protein [Pseudoruegeria sp. SK021]|uniref:hypothetical protein n=1 Tax=Pseudoruegeria sp. SK021 TaxID=1933035 RepID=UPI00111C08C4|nr:hypothetical protein [Pseudoruegeria sp. SK021]